MTFIAAVTEATEDESLVLCVPSTDLLRLVADGVLKGHIYTQWKDHKPSTIDYAGDVLTSFGGTSGLILGKALRHVAKNAAYDMKCRQTTKLIQQFTISRPMISIPEKERALLRGAAQLTADHVYSPAQWHRHLALTIWNAAACHVEADQAVADHSGVAEARVFLISFLTSVLPPNDVFLGQAAKDVALCIKKAPSQPGNPRLHNLLSKGSRWMSAADLPASGYYSNANSPPALLLGYEPSTDEPVYFADAESLITIGGPGSGKSQAHVIPNLLNCKGSAIVLDVKGELWKATAGYRKQHYGPVYRFAPTDPMGNTHRYNPFDFIPKDDPSAAANECSVFSYQVIEDNPNLKDPYWDSRGRDFFWAYAMFIALKAEGEDRTIQGLGQLMSTPLTKAADADIHQLIGSMRRLSTRIGITDLHATADALATGIAGKGERLESIVDAARRYLTMFNRSPMVSAAMRTSDWRPEMFRTRPGTTLYISLSPDELKTYAPVVRTMLVQHSRILQRHGAAPGEQMYAAKKGERPITFFLDEMPQLGNFQSILELQDVGRGAGLRLWMFAQSMGQLSKAFGAERFEGVIDACRVRCFLQPDNQAVKFMEPNLGRYKNMFAGTDEPLATAADLMGRPYQDKIIITSRGDMPMALAKKYAWQTDAGKFLPMPVVKR